jgi:hypothetical protein
MKLGNNSSRLLCLAIALVAGLVACSPGLSPAQVQALVETSVVGTVGAQNQMGTAVALTVSALAPAASAPAASAAASPPPLSLPTATAAAPTVTPFTLPTSAAQSKKPTYACDISQRPFDETAYKPGDPFDIKWTITNTGTKTWAAGLDFKYSSGTLLTSSTSFTLPAMKPNDKFSVSVDANAPIEKGRYVMTWIVEGRICSTSVVIISGRPGIDP